VNALFQIGATNALVALALAVVAAVAKLARRPALSHALWLLVLLKLITPPLVVIAIAWPALQPPPMPAATPLPAPEAELLLLCRGRLPGLGPPLPAPEAELPPVLVPVVPVAAEQPTDRGGKGQQREDEPAAALPVAVDQAAGPVKPAPLPPPEPAPVNVEIPWTSLLGCAWLLGSAAWFVVAGVRIGRFQRLLAVAAPAPKELQDEACRIAVRLGLKDCPGVWLMPGMLSPLLWAVAGYPRVLLPLGLLARLDPAQQATLLAHELAHYRRRDHWVRCVEFVALGLYWWFPVLWWARRELREAEEECCDAWVVWVLPGAVKAYAKALVETLDFLAGSEPVLPPAASGLGHLKLLQRRLTMIMRGTRPRMLTGLGFLAVLGLAALLLPLLPTLAQQPAPGGGQPGYVGQKSGVVFQQPAATDLEKAKGDLMRAGEELAKFKADLDRMLVEYENKTAQLKQALDAIKAMEKMASEKKAPAQPGGSPYYQQLVQPVPVMPGMNAGLPAGPNNMGQLMTMEKRLANMEKKLDSVLHELVELRKQLGKKGAGGFAPDAPGTGVPKLNNFVPGSPGAPPGPGVGPGGPATPGAPAGPTVVPPQQSFDSVDPTVGPANSPKY
jgi:beta-lactamase regulating signal transducer with metallopeptidase domain